MKGCLGCCFADFEGDDDACLTGVEDCFHGFDETKVGFHCFDCIMGTVVKYLQRVTGKASFKDIFWDTVKYALMDGKVAETAIFHGYLDDAKLVGIDKFGNQYYERVEGEIYGRHRWVVYADKKDYSATTVSPEWHGWLHYVSDVHPENHTFRNVVYKKEWMKHPTGTDEAYLPKGSWFNPYKRNWEKYATWKP